MLAQNQLNREYAMALCTVIAIGHLVLDGNESPLLHEPDDESNEDHAILMSTVLNSPIAELRDIIPEVVEQPPKSQHPFIYASPGGVVADRPAQNAIDFSLQPFTDSIEHYFRNLFDGLHRGFSGAYIGGIAQLEMVRLYCPSLMYQYDTPNYLRDEVNLRVGTWERDYRRFVNTTETILDIFAHNSEPQTDGSGIYYPDINESRALINAMPEELLSDKIFGSVHGLVTSMNRNFQNNRECFNIELALSNGTNKVASCLPCAIFARSQNTPASYTHLGRGDYWNLPENVDANMRYDWETYVVQCYTMGMSILGAHLKALSDGYENFFNALDDDHIPNVFLSSLMFPGAFVKKMNSVFKLFRRRNDVLI